MDLIILRNANDYYNFENNNIIGITKKNIYRIVAPQYPSKQNVSNIPDS